MGGSRLNVKDFVLCNTQNIRKNLHGVCGKAINVCVVDCVCCCESFQKFLTWTEPEPKRCEIARVLRTADRRNFIVNQWYRGKPYTPNVSLWGLNSRDINNSIWGTPNTRIFRVPEIHFDVERFAKFEGKLFFKSDQKWRSRRRKIGSRVVSGIRKALKSTRYRNCSCIQRICAISVANT